MEMMSQVMVALLNAFQSAVMEKLMELNNATMGTELLKMNAHKLVKYNVAMQL